MPQKIRMWEVTPQNTLSEITSSEINLEERLEDWLESDISMLDPNLLVIGRQVRTDFGSEIDLLCLDSAGALVVVELKKGRTPRDVTAQALDYASWVKDLSYQRIEELAAVYLKGSLEEAFVEKFGGELPESLNESHRSLIVAEAMDASTERIVRYLSDLKVPINVATVQQFRDKHGREILGQVFLIEPEVAETKVQPTSKRRPYVTASEMAALANEIGVGDLYNHLSSATSGAFMAVSIGSASRGFQIRQEGRTLMVLIVGLNESGQEIGLQFRLNGIRLMNQFGLSEDKVRDCLPEGFEDMPATEWRGATKEQNWVGFQGYFRTTEEIDKFFDALKQ